MVRPFEEIWAEAEKIWGLVLEDEMRLLYEAATSRSEGAQFLEIGSLCGRSAAVLGMVAMDLDGSLVCVDNFMFVHSTGSNCINRIMKNLKRCDVRFTMMMMDSAEAARQCPGPFDLVHIDGNHRRKPVEIDCKLWLRKLAPGGLAAFHDYHRIPDRPAHPGVKKAVDPATIGYVHFGAAGRLEVRQRGTADAYPDF